MRSLNCRHCFSYLTTVLQAHFRRIPNVTIWVYLEVLQRCALKNELCKGARFCCDKLRKLMKTNMRLTIEPRFCSICDVLMCFDLNCVRGPDFVAENYEN